jgi:hypothetical protein
MSGSGGDAGYDFQAEATAFVASYAIAEQPLDWFDDVDDVPAVLIAESGGPGDDLRIETTDGRVIELQAKHGLAKDERFWEAILRLAKGLQAEPALRGVLLVDTSASSPIKTDFRKGLLRGGRIDVESQIITDVRDRLSKECIEADVVLPRLRVIVKDFGSGADGRDAALVLIRQVVGDPKDVATVWRVLTDEGHKLIKHRGRRDVKAFVGLVGRHASLKADLRNTTLAFHNYCRWLERTTDRFEVPGLGESLSIEEAWIELRVVEDQKDRRSQKDALERMLREYHEWQRLADDLCIYERWDVDTLRNSARRCVVVGGPGCGKSTFIQRLGHDLAKRDRLVLCVRLKRLSRKLETGATFDTALASFASESVKLSADTAMRLVNELEYLIADGLDECDPGRSEVAQHLRSWSDGHPKCRIIVTTRPVGHHPGLLPGFDHLELLPLSDSQVHEHARRLFSLAMTDEDESIAMCTSFLKAIDEDKAKGARSLRTLAARNPLLLGFLVRLAIDHRANVESRAELFSQTVALMESTPNSSMPCVRPLNSKASHRALDAMAFQLIDDPASDIATLRNRVEVELAGIVPDAEIAAAAETVFDYWQQRRVIEKLTAGHLSAITFVHPAFGEFAAARYITRLADDAFAEWFRQVRREPRWYQPIVLGACLERDDRILQSLLDLDEAMDPESSEAVTAAAAVAEGAGCTERIRERVATVLLDRLSSSIPLLSVESALALLPIAAFSADIVGNTVSALLEHPQEWTRLSARCLRLACHPANADVDWFENWFRTFNSDIIGHFGRLSRVGSNDMPAETVELQHRLVELGLRLMISRRSRDYIATFFEDKDCTDSLSTLMFVEISQILRDAGFSSQADEMDNRHRSAVDDYDSIHCAWKKETDVLLESMLVACDVPTPRTSAINVERFMLPGMVIEALSLGKSLASHARYLRLRVEFDAIVEVVRGAIAALELDVQELASEAAAVRRILCERKHAPIASLIPRVPCRPDWSRTKDIGLKPELLEIAVRHPHWSIAVTATKLLEAGASGDALKTLVANVLRDGRGRALQCASYLAQHAYGEDLPTRLWDRLREGITHGCEHLARLVIRMVSVERRDELLRDVQEWLVYPGSRFAAGVANSLSELTPPIDRTFESVLREAFEYWSTEVTWCDVHQIRSNGPSCPKCRYILPCAKAEIFKQLEYIGSIEPEEVLLLLKDEQDEVAKVAKESLLRNAVADSELVRTLLTKIAAEDLSIGLLEELSALPRETRRDARREFLALLDAERPVAMRNAALAHLSAGWVSVDEVERLAMAAVKAPAPSIRTQAARALRSLRTSGSR